MRKGKLVYKRVFKFSEFSGQTFEEIANRIVIPILQEFNLKGIQAEKIFINYQPTKPKFDTLYGKYVKLSVRIYRNPKDVTLIIRLYPATPNGKLLLINWSKSIFQVISHFKHILKFKL